MSRPGFVPAPSTECPSHIGLAVYDVRAGRADEQTYTTLRTHWGPMDFYLVAVDAVYYANDWEFNQKEKTLFRKIFRGTLTE